MVSFQAVTLFPSRRNTTPEFEESSKKRKWEEEPLREEVTLKKKLISKTETTRSIIDIDLHLHTPLPLEWQRCLDIKSGEIHFYNTRTHKRTSKDPRRIPEPEPPSPPSSHMSLDLELNLPCDSPRKNKANENDQLGKHNSGSDVFMDSSINKKKNGSQGGLINRYLSWMAFDDEQQEEMVATVCIKCHMLVMLCKSSPACPNCKFMHPLDQTPPKLSKPRLNLLC